MTTGKLAGMEQGFLYSLNHTAARIFPPLQWLPQYQLAWLSNDIIAGVMLTTYAIPVSLAYASLAGVSPQSGIYCYLVGGLVYALLGSSRQLAIGPTSAIAMLVGTSVATMAKGDAARWGAIAALAALIAGILGGIAWVLKLSGLVSFISETILVGFKAGAALSIALTQLPKLFGVSGGGDSFFERLWILAGQLGQTNVTVLMLGLAALALILLGERLLPGLPVTLVVVAAATCFVGWAGLGENGVAVVGTLPAGLPKLAWPSLRPSDVDGVLSLAAACFLLSYVESVSAGRTLAKKHGGEIDPRQELLALGAANVAVAFCHGFPIAGGLSQSAVNDKAGAKSPLSLVFASTSIALCLLFLTDLLHNLPTVVLAAIVLVAVRGLIDLDALQHLWKVSRFEFSIAMVALMGVLLLGVLNGVLIAAVVSILLLLTAVAHPHVALLGRIPGTRRYSDLERHPDNDVIEGVLIFRVEASLLYFNVDHVQKYIHSKMDEVDALRLVVCDLSSSPLVDVAGTNMLRTLHVELAPRGAYLRIVGAHSKVRDLLRAEGLEVQVGYLGRHRTLDETIHEFTGQASNKQSINETSDE